MTVVHVVVPDGIDDPARPSGGNAYDRRICHGLAEIGWPVHVHAVPGSWPLPDAAAYAALTTEAQRDATAAAPPEATPTVAAPPPVQAPTPTQEATPTVDAPESDPAEVPAPSDSGDDADTAVTPTPTPTPSTGSGSTPSTGGSTGTDTGGDAGGIPQAGPVAEVGEEEPTRCEHPRDLAQPLHGGEGGGDLPAGIRVQDDEVGAGGGERSHALLTTERAHPDPVTTRQGQLTAHGLGERRVRLEHDLG